MQKRLRTYFLAGVGFLLPLGIALIFLRALFFIVSGISKPLFNPLFSYFLPQGRIEFFVDLTCAAATLALVTLAGFAVTKVFGKALEKRFDDFIGKFPGIGDLYAAVKKLTKMVVSGDEFEKHFQSVVLAEWPTEGRYVMGLITSEKFHAAKKAINKDLVMVLIPTPPNPINGFLVMLPRERLTPLDMRVDEAVKILFSLGLTQ